MAFPAVHRSGTLTLWAGRIREPLPMDDAEPDARRRWLGALVRRIRRTADLSQRELARALDTSVGAVAQAETGRRDLPATVLARAAQLAGIRLALLDPAGQEVPGMAADAVRDRGGRHFPAHLDTRYGDQGWWHGEERYSREAPWYTFDRRRDWRDEWRAEAGTPPDHQEPRPGDSPEARAQARRTAAAVRRAAAHRQSAAERRRRGLPSAWTPTCACPPACDELLFAPEGVSPRHRAEPHVDDCPCRCDIA